MLFRVNEVKTLNGLAVLFILLPLLVFLLSSNLGTMDLATIYICWGLSIFILLQHFVKVEVLDTCIRMVIVINNRIIKTVVKIYWEDVTEVRTLKMRENFITFVMSESARNYIRILSSVSDYKKTIKFVVSKVPEAKLTELTKQVIEDN